MTSPILCDNEPASAWVKRWSHLVPAGQAVLDVACGQGRHLRWFAGRGHPVVGIDRSSQALAAVGLPAGSWQSVLADIEGGPWPLPNQRFAAVVVTNYLWRDLLPTLVASVAPGGVLIYETFAVGQASVGKPSRPDFLLRPGELLAACADLRVVAYEDGHESDPQGRPTRFLQRIAALRPLDPADPAPRLGPSPA
jgi:SAM-dependent methyltransferase